MTDKSENRRQALRALPSVDALLRTEAALSLRETLGAQHLADLARRVTEELRARLQKDGSDAEEDQQNGDRTREGLLAEAALMLRRAGAAEETTGRLRRVVNASGVILHTNLGRAPLSEAARDRVAVEAGGYCTLEYDALTGRRGRRGARVEQLLTEVTGAEAALVVNNCAAAALLVLTALAQGGESLVSRGELVEIGGDFRVPDVMAQSGTRLVEVGTTNRTRLADYERAITEGTRLIVRVHTSNYRIVGFTATPSLAELAELAHKRGLTLYEDAGSGALFDLRAYGLEGEPVILESVRSGADVVSFSGDKLLGAAQAGLIVGRRPVIEALRKHPLYRALRADKLALAALEATLEAHRRGASFKEVPALRMLAMTREEIEGRARALLSRLAERRGPATSSLRYEVTPGESAIGGGSAPTAHPQTALIALTHEKMSADALEEALRSGATPVIARIMEDKVLLDLRTVAEDEDALVLDALSAIST
ncbi:MAG TPA: L-seryl-tRNA(Sec) selenium transferase [Pyrinomonadaceae bacterium]|jgi:L-seryl-tRNA(Ser) seleniumtransferase|nr:L-seryl-tRNA(Sec) selenium transferase [Pyrinomonadaceae bacterium]